MFFFSSTQLRTQRSETARKTGKHRATAKVALTHSVVR